MPYNAYKVVTSFASFCIFTLKATFQCITNQFIMDGFEIFWHEEVDWETTVEE